MKKHTSHIHRNELSHSTLACLSVRPSACLFIQYFLRLVVSPSVDLAYIKYICFMYYSICRRYPIYPLSSAEDSA